MTGSHCHLMNILFLFSFSAVSLFITYEFIVLRHDGCTLVIDKPLVFPDPCS